LTITRPSAARQAIENKARHGQALPVRGFAGKARDGPGRLARHAFSGREAFSFEAKAGGIGGDSITIGGSPNGKWACGVDPAASKTGSRSWPPIFGDRWAQGGQCLENALESLVAWHEKENDSRAAPVVRQARDAPDEIAGSKPARMPPPGPA
jgi:hypothetical protein